MSDPILTSGIDRSNGPVPLRREIRSLQKDFPDHWNLYILGLEDFQAVDENDPLSYYQIAGIHGLPYKPWNDVTGPQPTGYCTHSSILFPTWHRPYLALFEETLYKHVLKIANQFTDAEGKARYVTAAREFRMPYWDWAVVVAPGQSVLPSSISSASISVIKPKSGGKATTIDNPLYSFRFHPVNPSKGDFPDAGMTALNSTVRWPRNGTAVSQNQFIASSIELANRNRSSNLRERLTLLVTRYNQYGPFSNDGWNRGRPAEYGSLETIHDTLHVNIGGQGSTRNDWPGHMTMISYASFDPAFWLHHTNVDRLFAIWQAIYPDTYVTEQLAFQSTVTTAAGETEDNSTNLTPFWKDSDNFWKSEGVRTTGVFGYAYPETQSWQYDTKQKYSAAARTAFQQLYGGSNLGFILRDSVPGRLSNQAQIQTSAVRSTSGPTTRSLLAAAVPQKVMAAVSHEKPKDQSSQGSHKTERDIKDLEHNGKYLEWITNLKVQKHALGTTFTVHVFLGDFDTENAASWLSAPNKVGTFAVLGDSAETGCGKCKKDQESELQITSQIPLTLALVERYLVHQLDSLRPESVVPYLQKNLHWRATLASGEEKPRGQIPDLVVSVISNEVTVPTEPDQFPIYAPDVQIHPECTTALNGDGRGEGTGLTHEGQA